MCIVVFALDSHPRYSLILAANRDEFFSRPTLPAQFWEDDPRVLAGRDVVAGGTWLGVTREGRVAAVTYFRERPRHVHRGRSRGLLAADFLTGCLSPQDYMDNVRSEQDVYAPFNLICGNGEDLRFFSNRGGSARISSGVHAVSNGPFDSRWPKVAAAKTALSGLLADDDVTPASLFRLLARTERFPDEELPDTGVGIQRERLLSPVFIEGDEYGTRSSTVVLLGRDGRITFIERSFPADEPERVFEL